MIDPRSLEARRTQLLRELATLRERVADLRADYGTLADSGMLVDTEGIAALLTPGRCIAGAREVFEEAEIELAAAADAVDRASVFTTRLRPVLLD
ncbi:hypothetical protein OHB26_34175 [Nocardia sp. NBC_01503]|uniref:hypothetical protein n=1 Tax=Nocardia sp. NBC_01503 TaxID=2975997 RepID=UPI002E7B9F32|nr:hypothetical protein [Nocardia sp. NBC_01503]WTL31891.1 hypothetical protein OHB26_34175 [Nocardia sp. NBC_01503]